MAHSTEHANMEYQQEDSVNKPDDEQATITLIRPQIDSAEASLKDRVLAGRIIAPRILNRVEVKNNLWKMWEAFQGLHVKDLANNQFAITFQDKNQAGLVLAKAPWFILSHLMNLQPWGEAKSSTEIDVSKETFWVQLHGPPLAFLNVEPFLAIGSRLGPMLEIESPIVNGCMTKARKGKEPWIANSNYRVDLPEGSKHSSPNEVIKSFDQATEKELISVWNERCSLKRDRVEKGSLDEVEDELLRRQRQKREVWFDDDRNVECVAIMTPLGIQTYVPDAEGNLVLPSP